MADHAITRRRLVGVTAAFAAVALVAAVPAAASPYIHAHRGGPLQTVDGDQVPRFPEDTMPAFRHAARQGFVIELDVKLTRDRVPVVIHDATLDRTTDCKGEVADFTFDELRDCRVDYLGTEGNSIQLDPGDRRTAGVPPLTKALRLAKKRGVGVNLEIKNIPTDPDFDVTDAYAHRVIRGIIDSGFPPSRLIIQSFWPPNLDVAEDELPDADTAFLTLSQANHTGPGVADARGYEWISPAWPVTPDYIAQAHHLGLQIVPYTIDSGDEMKDAATAGVDAIITNDPGLARKAVKQVEPEPPKAPDPPSRSRCRQVKADRTVPPIEAFDPAPNAPRVFAMQYKQEVGNVETYRSFRTKIECMILKYVEPNLARHRPNVVAFNEDIGLLTLGTGSRGAAGRALVENPANAPGCEGQPSPCGAVGALLAVRAGYSKEVTEYDARFPGTSPLVDTFIATTDTFARGWMQTFADMAKRYDVYILGSNNQAPFRESTDPSEIAAFRDPDMPRPDSVFVATEGNVYNEAFMWAPHNVRKEGPPMLRNVVAQNRKVPLTELEQQIGITDGPSTGPDAIENVRPYHVAGTRMRMSFATSLPAFVFNGSPTEGFGEPLDAGINPCSDTSRYYMRCVDALGANVVIQDEANPGRWAVTQPGGWQPLEWMSSSWRHVGDPTADFKYNVTPFMVGNLADVVFDGQSSITQRGRGDGNGCHYIGNGHFRPNPPENDPEEYDQYAGHKREFLGVTPWVKNGSRDYLRTVAARLAPQSGSPLENDYVESAIAADLPFPVDRNRPACLKPGE